MTARNMNCEKINLAQDFSQCSFLVVDVLAVLCGCHSAVGFTIYIHLHKGPRKTAQDIRAQKQDHWYIIVQSSVGYYQL